MSQLPTPSADALALSDQLVTLIRDRIEHAGGWISFAEYMELVLYAPGLGYYSNGARKFGAEGDFITAPEMGYLFAHCMAKQLSCWLSNDLPNVLEIGPGTGKLAFDLLSRLDAIGHAPARYYLLERSGDLRQRQQTLLANLPAHLAERVVWLDSLPSDFCGVIVANEVLDAIPAHRIGWRAEGLVEQGVTWGENGLGWAERPLCNPALESIASTLNPPTPYTTEINLAASAWVGSLLDSCQRAALIFIDYGYGRPEFYHPQRDNGTLTGFYRHHRLNAPFFYPGLVDLTTHVDFSAVADAAFEHKAILLGYTTQASFLMDCKLIEPLEGIDPRSTAYMKLSQEAQQLTHIAEMGELFKVMAIGKGVEEPGIGFTSQGREFQL